MLIVCAEEARVEAELVARKRQETLKQGSGDGQRVFEQGFEVKIARRAARAA
jgi:hypothetical protein